MIQNMGCAYAQNSNNILNIQKLKFLSLKFPKKLGGNLR
jgi:hypothetical protein